MLKTVKKVSSHPTCNNVLEKFMGFSPFGSHQHSSSCYLAGPSQFRSFFLLSNGCLFNSTNRVLATSDNYHVPIEKANEMNYFWEDYTKKLTFKRRCINKVSTLLNCREKIATELVEEHPILFLEDIDITWENIQLLTENGITTDIIKKNLWLLYCPSDDLQTRITTIQSWNTERYAVVDFLALFKLSPDDFQRTSEVIIVEKDKIPYGNRIIYLANLLEVPLPELAVRLVRHKYTLWRNLDLIVESIKCYFEFGISGKDLMDDIWALRYSEPVIRRRLRIAKENDVPHMKAWYVRCSEEKFERTMEIFKLEKAIMHPHKTRAEFLSNKLNIDLTVVKTVMQRHEIYSKIHLIKLAEMIDYLLSVGFRNTEICASYRIFEFSVETVKDRINELKGLGLPQLSLSMLITDETRFRKLVDRIQYINSLQRNPT